MKIWRRMKRAWFSWRAKRGLRVLRNLDRVMAMAEWNRTKRRQFWRDFIAHSKTRLACLDQMAREMEK